MVREFVSTPKLGDLLKSEYDYRYTRRGVTWTNGTGESVKLRVGQPFSINESTGAATPVDDGGEGGIDGILLMPVDVIVPKGEAVDLALLVRGPALVNKDALPDTSMDGGDYDKDAIAAALESMSPPIICITEPGVSAVEEQTT